MKKSLSRGFTLIELLVVVAIIALLAATILSSLGSARSKAKDAKIVSELSSIRAQMELYYSTNGSFGSTNNNCGTGPFASTDPDNASALIKGIAQDINGNATNFNNIGCWANAESWAVQAILSTGNYWCVDSSGRSLSIGVGNVWGNGGVYTCQ